MTKSYYWGTLGTGNGDSNIDGSINLNNNELPWIGAGDDVSLDVNAGDTAMIKISKKDMPNWSSVLKVGRNTLTMIDKNPAVAWNDPAKIKFFGVITKLNPKHKEFLTIKADSILVILNRTGINPLFNATSTKPSEGVKFEGSTWQTVLANIVRYGMNTATAPAGQRPANIMGNYDGGSTGTTYNYSVRYIDNPTVGNALTELRDRLTPNGTEFRFIPRFYSSAMNRIVVDMKIGTDDVNGAHLNENQTVTINIETPSDFNKMVEMSTVFDLDGVATRWIGSSKAGDETLDSGSDVTTVTNTTTGLPRLDSFFNPGVELTTAEMSAQLNARINTSTNFAEMTYSVEEDKEVKWADHIGKTINFVGAAGTEYADFNATVRCVSINFNASTDSVRVGLMAKQPRYPVLPKDRPRGVTGIDTSSPINPPKAPNVPKPSAGGGGIVVGDDWDKGGALGQDKATELAINIGNYYQNTEELNAESSQPRHREFWYQGIEGHTIIADDANGRFLGINYAHMATMWPDKISRGSLMDLVVSKSRKMQTRPTVTADQRYEASDAQVGISGNRGNIMTLNWATISADALPGTLDGYTLKYEVFNHTLSLYGAANNRTVMITVHQLQLFEGSGDNRLRSKDFSYIVTVDGSLDPTGPVTPVSGSVYQGNSAYDAEWTFYAYGNQIGYDTSGDIEKAVILTPRAYPKDETVPKPNIYDDNYWASINQGAYATWNIALIKNWVNGTVESQVGPSETGKDYRQMTFLQIPWIDQSQIINNTFGCVVLGEVIYAHAMTSYGKKIDTSYGENLIKKTQFLTKPSKGIGTWSKVFSGKMMRDYSQGSGSMTVFSLTWRRNPTEVAFFNYGAADYEKILVKNGVDAVRLVKPSQPLDLNPVNSSFMDNNTYSPTDSFSDFYAFKISDSQTVNNKWIKVDGLDWGIFLWNGGDRWNGDIQHTLPNKSLRGSNFSVSIYACNQPGMGYDSNYGRGFAFWSWEL